jgi:hypothetical protein
MPVGMKGVRGVVQDIEARKNSSGGGGPLWLKVGDGESVTVRFLEQGEDVKWAWCHEVPQAGQQWPRLVVCRDQDEAGQQSGEPCPGCEANYKRKFQGWINVIWRDAPVFEREKPEPGKTFGRMKKGPDGRLIQQGTEDQVAVWQAGVVVFEELDGKDVTYKGLTSRDFVIKRRGTGMATKYTIEPADPDAGPVVMSSNDKKLAEGKQDLTGKVSPEPYDSWGKTGEQREQQQDKLSPADTSPFMAGRR